MLNEQLILFNKLDKEELLKYYNINKLKSLIGCSKMNERNANKDDLIFYIKRCYALMHQISLFKDDEDYSNYVVPTKNFDFKMSMRKVYILTIKFKKTVNPKRNEVFFKCNCRENNQETFIYQSDIEFIGKSAKTIKIDSKYVKIYHNSSYDTFVVTIDAKILKSKGVAEINLRKIHFIKRI